MYKPFWALLFLLSCTYSAALADDPTSENKGWGGVAQAPSESECRSFIEAALKEQRSHVEAGGEDDLEKASTINEEDQLDSLEQVNEETTAESLNDNEESNEPKDTIEDTTETAGSNEVILDESLPQEEDLPTDSTENVHEESADILEQSGEAAEVQEEESIAGETSEEQPAEPISEEEQTEAADAGEHETEETATHDEIPADSAEVVEALASSAEIEVATGFDDQTATPSNEGEEAVEGSSEAEAVIPSSAEIDETAPGSTEVEDVATGSAEIEEVTQASAEAEEATTGYAEDEEAGLPSSSEVEEGATLGSAEVEEEAILGSAEVEEEAASLGAEEILGSAEVEERVTTSAEVEEAPTTGSAEVEEAAPVSAETEDVLTGSGEAEEVVTESAEAEEVVTGSAEAEEGVTGSAEAEEVVTGSGEAEEVVTGSAEAEEGVTGSAEAEEVVTGSGEAEEVVTGSGEAEEVVAGSAEVEEVVTGSGEAEEVVTGSAEAEEVVTGSGEAEEVVTGSAEAEEDLTGSAEAEELSPGLEEPEEEVTETTSAEGGEVDSEHTGVEKHLDELSAEVEGEALNTEEATPEIEDTNVEDILLADQPMREETSGEVPLEDTQTDQSTEQQAAEVQEPKTEDEVSEQITTSAEESDVTQTSEEIKTEPKVEQTEESQPTSEETEQPTPDTPEVQANVEETSEESATAEKQEKTEDSPAQNVPLSAEDQDETVTKSQTDEVSGETVQEEAAVEVEEETPEQEDLTLKIEIPENLRSRDHIFEILKLDNGSADIEARLLRAEEITLRELKKVYENAIKPLEILYKYRDLSNRHFGDPEIFSKPLILFMGPWSGGKSSIINYLLDNEFAPTALRTGAEPSPAYFNIVMWGDREEVMDGTQLAADWTFSGLQKFGQGLLDRLRGLKLTNPLLEKVNIVEIPGILEIRKQVERLFPLNDACQWFIDRADIIFLVYDPSKLDVGPETEAILDQLKGREYQTKIILNKADQVKPEELMRVQGTLIWNISPLMSSTEPPVMYSTSLWSHPYQPGSPSRLLFAQEKSFLKDLREAMDKRVENKISSARRFAVRVRNHAKMVDCYLTTYYNHKTFFGDKQKVSDDIIEHPQNYHIYEGLSTLTNISRYDLPDPDVYRDFFRLNPVYDFQQLASTCTYFRGCPIHRLDVAIAYDLPELVGKYKKMAEDIIKGQGKK